MNCPSRLRHVLRITAGCFFALLMGLQFLPAEDLPLLEEGGTRLGWSFDNGQEFAGATGELVEQPDGPDGRAFLRLSGNFNEGGSYVQMLRNLNVGPIAVIKLKVRTTHDCKLLARLIDSTGQCHQGRPLKISPDGEWQEIVIDPALNSGGEHWGGANDGVWHDPPAKLAFLLSSRGGDKEPAVDFADIQAEAAK